ncbi:hypothetical protein [Aromatoleum diolicum]|uniref:DUF4148 domain-containing protein n=1 Tax=Aromatoleum diolicum TaxID=75796 RepID=A0ABX1QEM5_9RHOO|nr:hypothetical protein [Aromatoleum diolicum]NMG76882.1 hypothetical protein [Aromatoleum diolicum]
MKGSGLAAIFPIPPAFRAGGVGLMLRNAVSGRVVSTSAVLIAALASALVSTPGLARDRASTPSLDGGPLIIYHNTPDQRRAELRRALISGADFPQAPAARPRMSQERRDALNQELREAVRGAYQQR